jgi:hypothetical protein
MHSLTLVIDSRDRDRVAYPKPSSYVIPFDEPIKNVVGFTILDASIPVTEYTIDVGNDRLALSYVFPSLVLSNEDVYRLIADMLYDCPDFRELFDNTSHANFFAFDTAQTLLDLPLADESDGSYNMGIAYRRFRLSAEPTVNAVSVPSVANGKTLYLLSANDVSEYIRVVATNTTLIATDADVTFYHVRYMNDSETLSLAARVNDVDCPYTAMISNVYNTVPNRNFDSSKLHAYLNNTPDITSNEFVRAVTDGVVVTAVWQDGVSIIETSITQRFVWTLTTLRGFGFFFDMQKSTVRDALGFSEINASNNAVMFRVNARIFESGMSTDDIFAQELVTPGIIALERVQYIELHCPEIESHMLGHYAHFRYAPGIGLFKLIDSNTVTHLRFDFLNIERMPFHPIGKLSRMTLSFRRKDGALYNFKGVDHTILVAIKYYTPKAVLRLPRSSLNAAYDPDVLKYQMNNDNKKKAVGLGRGGSGGSGGRPAIKMADVVTGHALASTHASNDA